MRAVYSAAMVQALLEEPIHFSWVCGNSASTSHVAYYIAKDAQRMRETFTTLPSHPQFGGLRTWARGHGFFNADFLYGQAGQPGHPVGVDWEAFQASPVRYRFSGFNAAAGETVHWGHERYNATKRHIFDLERQGRAYIVTPEHMRVGNSSRNRKRLETAYATGLAQARREMPAILDFLAAGGF